MFLIHVIEIYQLTLRMMLTSVNLLLISLTGQGKTLKLFPVFISFFSSISLIVGASRLMEAQMVASPVIWRRFFFIIFIVTSQMFTFSLEYVENV